MPQREFDKRYNIGSPPADLQTQFNNLLTNSWWQGYYWRRMDEKLLKMGKEKAIKYLDKKLVGNSKYYYEEIVEKSKITLSEIENELKEHDEWKERSKDRIIEHFGDLFENIIKGGLYVASSSPPPKK